jgi:hypothetical protein
VIVKYSSNNSGGDWWLDDKDWHALEAAGWKVEWFKDDKDLQFIDGDKRFLGALATYASKEFPYLEDGIKEWEQITGQDAEDKGCECCGQPHYFYQVQP